MLILQDDQVIAAGRIAGDLQSGELAPAAVQGSTYTFADIPLREGQQNIRLLLTGSQNLVQGAYLLQPQNTDASQTMVCVAQGTKEVNVQMDLVFDLQIQDEILQSVRFLGDENGVQNPDTGENFLLPAFVVTAGLSLTACTVLYRKRRR